MGPDCWRLYRSLQRTLFGELRGRAGTLLTASIVLRHSGVDGKCYLAKTPLSLQSENDATVTG